jgi:RimJ/RimL family protein N-acetyltransferase
VIALQEAFMQSSDVLEVPQFAPDSCESESSCQSLSHVLWGIDWRKELPIRVARDETAFAVFSNFERSLPFIQRHYSTIFEDDGESPFTGGKLTGAKIKYYREVADFFEFQVDAETAGLLICTPVDWSTYYIRSAAVLPQHQGKKLIQRFLPLLFDRLRQAGVERIEADTSPANMATMHLLTRLRFNVTGTVLTDRWGGLVRFTRYLEEGNESVFLGQFCSGVKYQVRERASSVVVRE